MVDVRLEKVRLSFPDLFVAKPFISNGVATGEPKYKASFLIEKGSKNDKAIEAAIIEAAKGSKWADKATATLKSIRGNANKFCYQDGDLKDYDGYKGHMVITASNVAKVPVFDNKKDPMTDKLARLTQADGRPYSGCYVNANISIFGYSTSGAGIASKLLGCQFHSDGEPFSGSPVATEDDFEAFESDDGEGLV